MTEIYHIIPAQTSHVDAQRFVQLLLRNAPHGLVTSDLVKAAIAALPSALGALNANPQR